MYLVYIVKVFKFVSPSTSDACKYLNVIIKNSLQYSLYTSKMLQYYYFFNFYYIYSG